MPVFTVKTTDIEAFQRPDSRVTTSAQWALTLPAEYRTHVDAVRDGDWLVKNARGEISSLTNVEFAKRYTLKP